ncbi:PcfJ domain-containing protein [Staphylococcus virus vB_SurM-PSU6]|nr:PcfJ domain-containing protein [Staphylococcus virus vB_SurM-PSU6]
MAITYKQKGLTEQEIINLPKVNKGSIYIGEEDVFLKKKKNNIINLGSKELFRDIHNIFSFDTATEIHLFLALCGNKEVTNFEGNPYETIEKLVEGVIEENKGRSYKEYIASSREERKEFPLYGRKSRKQIKSKGYVEEKIKELENKTSLWGYEARQLDEYKEEVDNLNDDIMDILDQGKYGLIKSSITSYMNKDTEKGSSKYYKEMSDSLYSSAWYMHPSTENNSSFGLKVRHIRDKHNMGNKWVLENKSSFDVKTGEVKVFLTDSLINKEIALNLYKDNISESEYKDELSLAVLLNVILKNYSTPNLSKNVIIKIIEETLRNDGFGLSSWCLDEVDVYERINYGGNKYKPFKIENSTSNYLTTLTDIVKNIDKINNLEEFELFERNSLLFHIPKNPKWKIHEAFHLTKQTYKKLLTLNNFEQSNYLRFSDTLYNYYNHLHNEVNLHQLFDDTFLMVQDVRNVTDALKVKPIVNEILSISFANYKKMTHYLDVDAQDRQRITGYALDSYYLDYLHDLSILIREGYRTLESVNLTPFSLKLEHDIVTDEKQSIQQQLDDAELKSKYENKLEKIIDKTYKLKDGRKVKFLPADTVSKLKNEGKMLSHCVGGYANRIIKNSCLILLARLEEDLDNSWFTVEIRITDNGYVLGQQQSIDAYKLPNELKEVLEKDIKKINKEEFKEVA